MVMRKECGWWATGKLYKHNEGVNTNFILDGASARTTLLSFDFSKILQPKTQWGYVYSANNQPEPVDGYSYPGYYLPEDRAKKNYNPRFKVKLG
jgi:penicillin amidase